MKIGRLLLKRLTRSPKSRPVRPAARSKRRPTKAPVRAVPPKADAIARGDLLASGFIRPDERLKHALEGFLLDQRSEHTRRAYAKDLKRFVQFLLVRKLRHGDEPLSRAVVIAYKDYLLAEKLEHTTVDRHLATLRSAFRWLAEEGLIAKSPVEGVRFLNPKRLSKTIGFTDEEVVRVLQAPNLHTRTGAQHYAILMTLFYCGLRRSEVCALRTSSVQIERGQPLLRLRGKGNSERLVVLTEPVWNALRFYFKMTGRSPREDRPLFTAVRNNRTGAKGNPLDPSMIFYVVTKYAKQAGVANRISPHSCRATAISNARDHNVPDRAIQEFAGWASPDMITRYDKRKSAIEKSAAHAIRYGAENRYLPPVSSDRAELPLEEPAGAESQSNSIRSRSVRSATS